MLADTGLSTGGRGAAQRMAAQRQLIEELGGEYRRITSNDVAAALVDLARAENATQIVLGASARSRWRELFSGSVINRVIRLSGPIDVHVISRPAEPDGRRRPAAARRQARAHAAVAAPRSCGAGRSSSSGCR